MAKLKILVWEKREAVGEPDVEVAVPSYVAKWIPKMMKLVPRKIKQELWGGDVDFRDLDLEGMIREAEASGEILDVKSKEARVKIYVEK